MDNLSANITEIFPSIQGEGVYIGYKQIFVRFSGCNLNCLYCDTDHSALDYCCVYENGDRFHEVKNPFTPLKLLAEIEKLQPEKHHSLSLTGGEPLLNAEFLKTFLKTFKNKYPQVGIYLETNGTLADQFNEIASYVDIIAMDIKIESSTHQPLALEDHLQFIKNSSDKNLLVKAVVSS